MPDPQSAPTPGANPPVDYSTADLDALFQNITEGLPQPPQAAQPDPTTPPVPPTVPQPEDFFLDAGSSKYRTREEATKGFAEKDSVIARLRQYAIEETGKDPLTGKAIPKPAAPTTEPVSYLKDGKRYVQDLVDAISKGSEGAERYADVQKRYFEEIAGNMFGPYMPVVRDAAKVRAIEATATAEPQFRAFLGSDSYTHTLDTFPDIKTSIEQAEADPRFAEHLPRFYRLAYVASLGLKAQETPPAPQHAAGVPAPQVRPTTSPGAITPPPTAAGPQIRLAPDELMRSPEGRKQLIEDGKARLMDVKF